MNPSFLELRALKFEPTHRNSISVNPEIFGLILLSKFSKKPRINRDANTPQKKLIKLPKWQHTICQVSYYKNVEIRNKQLDKNTQTINWRKTMQIADLNHLEIVEADVTGGFFSDLGRLNTKSTTKISFKLKSNINLDVNGSAKGVKGNTAQSESDAEAYGYNTVALVGTYTYTDDSASLASGLSISGTND